MEGEEAPSLGVLAFLGLHKSLTALVVGSSLKEDEDIPYQDAWVSMVHCMNLIVWVEDNS